MSYNQRDIPNKKKIAIALIAIIAGATIFSSLTLPSILGEFRNETITFPQSPGEIYYIGLRDSYFYENAEEGDYIKDYKTIIKSEILDKRDGPDWDDDEDLYIMSSIVMGEDNLFSIEIPNYFDIYTVLLDYQNFQKITGGTDAGIRDFNEWAIPSAIHYQSSSFYHFLEALIEQYNLNNITDQVQEQEFQDIMQMFNYIMMNTMYIEPFAETFDSTLDFEIETSDPAKNDAQIITDPEDSSNKILEISQSNSVVEGVDDDLRVKKDLFEFVNNTAFGERTNRMEEYVMYPNLFTFEYEPNENYNNHSFEASYLTDDFDMFYYLDLLEGGSARYTGKNGIQIRLKDSILQYYVGNYVYDLEDYYSNTDLIEVEEEDQGWRDIMIPDPSMPWGFKPLNFTEKLYNEPWISNRTILEFVLPEDNPYIAELLIETDSGYYVGQYDIPLRLDCPFDFRNETFSVFTGDIMPIFRFRNMTNLEFYVNGTRHSETSDLVDNINVDYNILWGMDNIEDFLSKQILSSISLLSFYHILLFPNEFNYEVLKSLAELVNIILGGFDFIEVEETEDFLSFLISKDSLAFFTNNDLFELMLMALGAKDLLTFVEGDLNFSMNLKFDKNYNCLRESYLTTYMEDMENEEGKSVIRKTGIELIAANYNATSQDELDDEIETVQKKIDELKNNQDKNADEIADLELRLEELDKGLIRVYESIPAEVPDEWNMNISDAIDEFANKALVIFLVGLFIGFGAAVAISVTIAHYMDNKKLKTQLKQTEKYNSRNEEPADLSLKELIDGKF